MIYHGSAVSDGYAVGPVYSYRPFSFEPKKSYIAEAEVPGALKRLREIFKQADVEITAVLEHMAKKDASRAKVFQAHRDILDDEEITEEISEAVKTEHLEISWAVASVFDKYIEIFAASDNTLIKERTADLRDVKNRLLRIYLGKEEKNLSYLPCPVIIAAHDLLPSDTATIDRANVLSIVTETGGSTSHSAIIARGYGIPAVLGVKNAMEILKDGEIAIVDAVKGEIITKPEEDLLNRYREKEELFKEKKRVEKEWLGLSCFTKDNVRVDIGMNIGTLNDAEREAIPACDFCGLFRTEFLYMDSDHMPTEEEQFEAYKNTLKAFGNKPVTLRTLDIGGDKTLPYFDLPREANPFLGKRAIRLCLANKDMFMTQLRAALRASVFGNLWLMFPMIGSIGDIRLAKEALNKAKESLKRDGIPFGSPKVGIMIEIPSIALIAREASEIVDFASIGTNDLFQYLSAADRQNPDVEEYYRAALPAVLRSISMTADAFNESGKPLSICGEMGGDPVLAPVLAGMGIKKLSMSASLMAEVKKSIMEKTMKEMKSEAERVLKLSDAEEIMKELKKEN